MVRKRFLVLSVGWGFLALGVAGLFLPVLQGVLFLTIGLIILSGEYAWAHKVLSRLQARFPRFARTFDEAARRARGWLARVPSR
jgi:uncharacterized membrane protein YbaN (DUF454 family)